ncbi:hypothetical protein Ddye_021406 [Dipteronia dyeriana]|uniref:Proline-rich protein PRCC n=1 Tax=Dipteronia dyeriana TaxID=168575 RepID=A0AAD9U1L4_9ROSI|nr:hypothetical protein Ddye_021406 [Dipteronia dyeriana]
MESLLANYASSDDEEESAFPTTKASSLFSSLPQPKQLLKNPKTETHQQDSNKPASNSTKPSSIFNSLPQPKSETPKPSTTKRVVKFMPPISKSNSIDDEDNDDEDDEEKERNNRKESRYVDQSSSVTSFLSSIPAPKSSSTLGVLPSGSGSGRRSIIETEVPALSSSGLRANSESSTDQIGVNYASYDSGSGQSVGNYANYEVGNHQGVENYANYEVGSDQNVGNYINYDSYHSGIDQNMQSSDSSSNVNYGGYNGYGDHGQYGSATMMQETAGVVAVPRKRGRNEIPDDIVEVKQDELMKNRPREDQAKLTGIAFGPSYQAVSTKGKPSKLHKRKHQIGSLYYDMRQKETELTERRSKGFLTKAQTQAKYGW